MGATITPEEIRETRGKYGLSQRAFASVLGIGAASIARYERGVQPTRANANLIRAAANPEFMMDCARREGSSLSQEQRDGIASVYYALIELPADSTPVANKMNEVYDLTLKQEVLNEHAANIMAEIISLKSKNGFVGKAADVFDELLNQIARIKPKIVSEETMSDELLMEIEGYLKCAEELLKHRKVEVAA